MHMFLGFSIPLTLYYQSLWMWCRLHLAFLWNYAIQSSLASQKKPGKTHNVKFFSFPEEEVEFHSFVPTASPPPEDRAVYQNNWPSKVLHSHPWGGKKLIRFPGLERFHLSNFKDCSPTHFQVMKQRNIRPHPPSGEWGGMIHGRKDGKKTKRTERGWGTKNVALGIRHQMDYLTWDRGYFFWDKMFIMNTEGSLLETRAIWGLTQGPGTGHTAWEDLFKPLLLLHKCCLGCLWWVLSDANVTLVTGC